MAVWEEDDEQDKNVIENELVDRQDITRKEEEVVGDEDENSRSQFDARGSGGSSGVEIVGEWKGNEK